MFDINQTNKLKGKFIEQYENKNATTILELIESIEKDLNKNIWDFDVYELKRLIGQLNKKDKDEVIKVLGDYVEFAIEQGYLMQRINNIKMFEDVL